MSDREIRDLQRDLDALSREVAALKAAAAPAAVGRVADDRAQQLVQSQLAQLLFTDSERTEFPAELVELRPLAIAIRDNTATAAQQRRFLWLLVRAVLRLYRGLFRL